MKRMIRFKFNEKIATQAAAFLLGLHRGQMDILRLMKLLYLAERESLGESGSPIIGDDYFALKHGPIVSRTNLLAQPKEGKTYWGQHLLRDGHFVVVHDDPGKGELSPCQLDILRRVADRHRNKDTFQLVTFTHSRNLPEWSWSGKAKRIPVERILEVLGKSAEDIEEIAKESEEDSYFDDLLSS